MSYILIHIYIHIYIYIPYGVFPMGSYRIDIGNSWPTVSNHLLIQTLSMMPAPRDAKSILPFKFLSPDHGHPRGGTPGE